MVGPKVFWYSLPLCGEPQSVRIFAHRLFNFLKDLIASRVHENALLLVNVIKGFSILPYLLTKLG
jgi:hypothetical protein